MRLMLLFLILCTSSWAFTGTYAQSTELTIDAGARTLEEVFKEIESESEFIFFYRDDALDLSRRVNVKKSSGTIEEILSDVLEDSSVGYQILDRQVIFYKEKTVAGVTQQIPHWTIKGVVKDEKGEAVIGANVVQKGTTVGTITDIDGQFEMPVSQGTILQVSYIGYNTKEVRITNQTAIQISLDEDNQALDEVVVVGYGTQKKVNLAGAVESINSKTLENRSTSNVGIALQGLVPNLNITLGGGQATDTPSFNVRGTTSINSADPLILVDGIPTSAGDFARMNGMDIENISVLKDASSAAIYGARAAFGVILVTTKKGQGEKLTVHFNNNFNVRTLTRMPKPVLDPYIQASYKKEMGKPWYDLYTDEELEYALKRREDPSLPGTIISTLDPSKYTYLDNTNWFDEVFDKIGTARSHNLSVSGANNKVSYYLGAEVYQERGMLKINKDIYDRFNMRTKVEYRPTEWLTVGNNTALTYYEYDKPMNYYSWLFSTVNHTNPLVPVYNPDGSYTSQGSEIVGTLKEGGKSKEKKATINTQFTADVELVKNIWNVKADFTAKFINSKLNEWDSDKTIPYRDGPDGPDKYHGWTNFTQSTHSNTYYTMFNLYTDVRKDFGIHSLSFVGGYSQEYEGYEWFYGRRRDMISESYPTPELAIGEMFINESITEWSIRSAFYRLNYILDGKYILETNGRYDGTSRFPSSDRFGFFPSVSAAWIVSNEKFFEKAHSVVSHLKLRTSYGSLGNQTVKNGSNENYYPYIPSMSASKVDYLLNGDKPMGIGAPGLVSAALTWEKVYTVNGGIDINFFKNRLTMSGDVYRRDTKDMLTKGKTLPNVLGTSEPQINAADLKTRGWEMTISWRDQFTLARKPFHYSARFLLSDSRSWITKFDNPTNYLGGSWDQYYVGREIGEVWGLETLGFFVDQADIDNSPDQWAVTSYPGDRPIEPGDLKYKDQNGDDVIDQGAWTVDDPGDYKIIGNTRSRYNFGLDLNGDWNGFDVRFFFQGVGKKDFFPSGYKFTGMYVAPWGTVLENNLDHWTPENPDAYFPRLKSYLDWGQGDLSEKQTRYKQNAAYLRMKNITFGYSLPKLMTRKFGVENMRFYFSGENLFEITKLSKNYDPEGLNDSSHPFQRTFSFGLNITL